jgi:hypothetical protein
MMTAAQIVSMACTIAKCPGYSIMAGQRLNEILVDLAIDQNLDIIRRTTTINVMPGTSTYALPANFLRVRECFYNVLGAVFYLTEDNTVDYDQLFTGPNNSAYPDTFMVLPENNTIQFYPLPITPLVMQLRYMDDLVEIATPETSSVIPWFQKYSYLVDKLAEKLMDITDDGRAMQFKVNNDANLRAYLKLQNGNVLKTVGMDPRVFNTGKNLTPTKLYP